MVFTKTTSQRSEYLTPQLDILFQLQQLLDQFAELKVLAFPCNQFGKQEPGSDQEIIDFITKKGFTGDLFQKIDVNGANEHEVFTWLKAQKNGGGFLTNGIKWNFTKFLLDKEGKVVDRLGSVSGSSSLADQIKKIIQS